MLLKVIFSHVKVHENVSAAFVYDPEKSVSVPSGTMLLHIDTEVIDNPGYPHRVSHYKVMTPSGFVGWVFEGNVEEVNP